MTEANQGISPQMPAHPFNLGNWMAAYQASQIQKTIDNKEPKAEVVEEKYEGGWRAEGKEKPVTPKVCPRCQWIKKNEQTKEPGDEEWCEPCLNGEKLGTLPKGLHEPMFPKADASNLNKSFFG